MNSFTKFSQNKNIRFFVKQLKLHLSRHTSEPQKKIIKILETRPQSRQNAQKWTKNGKIHDVDKSTLVFSFQQPSSFELVTWLTSAQPLPTCIADLIVRTETTEEPVQCALTLEVEILFGYPVKPNYKVIFVLVCFYF